MSELIISDKLAYLEENYPFADMPALTERKICIHCGKVITVGDYKVYKGANGFEYICCPNAPECNGTVIDWIDLK